ncbi:MAG TPA: ATP-binding protein, partial [Dehalococcoidia bacterium]|nr:ATP-binding protein [Dehalococcoidia bacterium]
IARLIAAANAIERGELGQRVPDFDRTELGDLARAFNEMSRSLQAAFSALAAERQRFVAVVSASTNGVIALDAARHIRYMNPSAEEILGMTREEAQGKPLLYALHQPEVHSRLTLVAEERRNEALSIELGPQRRWLRVLIMPLRDAGDWAFLIILVDLTEMRRLETVRRDFVSNVSHELRTPLAALRAAIETLQEGALDDRPAAMSFLQRMLGEVDRLTNLVDELLTLSRIEAQLNETLSREPVDIERVAGNVVERMRPQADRAGIRLSISGAAEGLAVSGDPEQLDRAVTNLVHNALKFTPRGGSVVVATRREDGAAVLEVRDTGVGMSTADQARAFERFFKSDRSRSTEGAGLGLAIVRHVIQAHGGEVALESELGRGTTIRCLLPIAQGEEATNS